ncbi:MAG: type II toxin-antitoxin system VapB family antitoxin [Acidobacteriota bacterium]
MPIEELNGRAAELAAEIARETGVSPEEAVIQSLEERLTRLRMGRRVNRDRRVMEEIANHCASLPDQDTRPADRILGYDDRGLL